MAGGKADGWGEEDDVRATHFIVIVLYRTRYGTVPKFCKKINVIIVKKI